MLVSGKNRSSDLAPRGLLRDADSNLHVFHKFVSLSILGCGGGGGGCGVQPEIPLQDELSKKASDTLYPEHAKRCHKKGRLSFHVVT